MLEKIKKNASYLSQVKTWVDKKDIKNLDRKTKRTVIKHNPSYVFLSKNMSFCPKNMSFCQSLRNPHHQGLVPCERASFRQFFACLRHLFRSRRPGNSPQCVTALSI